jgi:pilus assembly protein CpaF
VVEDLVQGGSLSAQSAGFLRASVEGKLNVLISGGTGSGKTTILNILSSFIGETERVVTIEDAAELKLTQEHVVTLESRPPNLEGKGAITIRDLLKNSLRMRPDRIVVGEVRGGEALDMLQAMNTGHDGSLSTLHANTPRDALSRLETMVMMAGMDLPLRAIRDQVASAVDLVVQIARMKDGSRKVTHITEICGMEGEVYRMQDIYIRKGDGADPPQRGEVSPALGGAELDTPPVERLFAPPLVVRTAGIISAMKPPWSSASPPSISGRV